MRSMIRAGLWTGVMVLAAVLVGGIAVDWTSAAEEAAKKADKAEAKPTRCAHCAKSDTQCAHCAAKDAKAAKKGDKAEAKPARCAHCAKSDTPCAHCAAKDKATTRPADKKDETVAKKDDKADDKADKLDPKMQWPQFHGYQGMGVMPKADVPTEWDAKTGKNILWKQKTPTKGGSSPILWGDKVFITGASPAQQQVLCYAAKDGKLLWKGDVGAKKPGDRIEEIYDRELSWAVSTPATDGKHVWAIFATGDIAAFTVDGKKVWEKPLGVPEDMFGYGSSLAVLDGNVIVQLDMGEFADLLCLEGATGKVVWKQTRDVGISYGSPTIIDTGKSKLIMTINDGSVVAHDPAQKGKIAWQVKGPAKDSNGSIAAAPILAGDMIVVVNPDFAELIGVSLDGKQKWAKELDDGLEPIPTPVSDGKLVYVLSEYGPRAVDPKTGKIVWKGDIDDYAGSGYPSLVLAGDKVLASDSAGVTWIFATGDKYKLLGKGKLPSFWSTPAVVGDRVYVRGGEYLYAIGKK